MKLIYQNWEKLIVLVLFCALFFVAEYCSDTLREYKKNALGRMSNLTKQQDELQEVKLDSSKYLLLFGKMRKESEQIKLSDLGRDIFTRLEQQGAGDSFGGKKFGFEVVQIRQKILDLKYLGRVAFAKGKAIVQVNISGKTYLLAKGEKVDGYKLKRITKDYIEFLDSNSESLRIDYRKIKYSTEFEAEIKNDVLGQVVVVSKGSKFSGYEVLSIDKNSMKVSLNGKNILLKEGMVCK
ncbi:MAG: hypothetical protein DRP78_00415 [Candidatus Omnitrophota bacterium]|nr:MAG: hypothetical protein DRP78_00415 [Candidatus Omnitrophota bacterium]